MQRRFRAKSYKNLTNKHFGKGLIFEKKFCKVRVLKGQQKTNWFYALPNLFFAKRLQGKYTKDYLDALKEDSRAEAMGDLAKS